MLVLVRVERLVMDDEAFTIIPTVEVGVMALSPEACQLERVSVPQPNWSVEELHRS